MNMIVAAVLAMVGSIIITWGLLISIFLLTKFISMNDVIDVFTTDLSDFFKGVI